MYFMLDYTLAFLITFKITNKIMPSVNSELFITAIKWLS